MIYVEAQRKPVSLLPECFLSARAKSIQLLVNTLQNRKLLNPALLKGHILNCGSYVGSSHAIGNYDGQVRHIERNQKYIDLGIEAGLLRQDEVICADGIDYLRAFRGADLFDLITFFGAPNNLNIDDFFMAGFGALKANGAVLVTGLPQINRPITDSCQITIVDFMEALHPWDRVVILGSRQYSE